MIAESPVNAGADFYPLKPDPSRRPHASSPGLENRRGMIAESPVIAGADFYPLKPASAA
jgi:hypothetical protein